MYVAGRKYPQILQIYSEPDIGTDTIDSANEMGGNSISMAGTDSISDLTRKEAIKEFNKANKKAEDETKKIEEVMNKVLEERRAESQKAPKRLN